MDWGRAFNYMMQDKDWIKKVLMGGVFVLLCFILIGIPFLLSYAIQVIKNVKKGQETPLPEWTNLGEMFVPGLMAFVTILIYYIPAIIISMIPCIGGIIGLIYGFLVMPTAFIMFAKYGDIGGALKFGEAIEFIKANIANLLIIGVMSIVFYLIALLGLIAICIGVLFTIFWAQLAYANLVGQLWRLVEPESTPAA